jgi:hypothetical protein
MDEQLDVEDPATRAERGEGAPERRGRAKLEATLGVGDPEAEQETGERTHPGAHSAAEDRVAVGAQDLRAHEVARGEVYRPVGAHRGEGRPVGRPVGVGVEDRAAGGVGLGDRGDESRRLAGGVVGDAEWEAEAGAGRECHLCRGVAGAVLGDEDLADRPASRLDAGAGCRERLEGSRQARDLVVRGDHD